MTHREAGDCFFAAARLIAMILGIKAARLIVMTLDEMSFLFDGDREQNVSGG